MSSYFLAQNLKRTWSGDSKSKPKRAKGNRSTKTKREQVSSDMCPKSPNIDRRDMKSDGHGD